MDEPDWLAEARRLATAFAARAAQHDRDGSFPFENFEDLRAASFLKLTVAREHGGFAAPLTTYLRVQEELAAGDGSTALAFMMHAKIFGQQRDGPTWPAHWMEEFSRGAVDHSWLVNTIATEEGLGSPAGGGLPDTVAEPDGDGWAITGRKTFSTMAPLLKYFVVLARVDGPAGPELASFVVYREDPGFRIDETWDALGMLATGSHDVVLERCRIPLGRLVVRGALGQPNARSAAGTVWFALGVAATTLGVGRAARDYAVAFAKERAPNALNPNSPVDSTPRTISGYPGVRMRVARIDLLLQRSRALIDDAARTWAAERGGAVPEAAGMSAINRVAVAKVDTLNNCIEAVDLAMRIVGGVGLLKSRPLERYYRDVRAGLHNPPLEDRALEMLARAAFE